jgi:integrase
VQVKLTQSYVQSLKADGKPHWIRDAIDNKLVLYLGKNGAKTWYVDYTRSDGKRAYHKIGPAPDIITVAIAKDAAREFLARVALGEDPAKKLKQDITLQALIDDFYASWVADNRRSATGTFAILHNVFDFLMDRNATEITALEIERWRAKYRQEHSTKAATVNRYVTTLKAILNWAKKHKIIETNPLAGMELLREEDSDRKLRYLSGEERRRLFATLDAREERIKQSRDSHNEWLDERDREKMPDLKDLAFADYLKPMILVSLNTGIRRGSLFQLRWSDIDFGEKNLTIRAAIAKGGREIQIPMNDILTRTLAAWKEQTCTDESGLVFPSPKGGGVFDNVRKAWAGLLQDAGIKNFRWHDMRHDFASQLVMKGVDLNTVRELMGHADMKMTLKYAHLAPKVKRAAVETLD